jgi:hypothetical protein
MFGGWSGVQWCALLIYGTNCLGYGYIKNNGEKLKKKDK